MSATADPSKQLWFGHPRGLATLFFTEMWERFSYYGMRALLVLFMTDQIANKGLGWDTVKATAIYGLYTFAVYAVALPGGWMADRIFGKRKAVFIGGVFIALGQFTLVAPGETAFFAGLALIVAGTALLKPNISAIVGDLYKGADGARRDAGFSIYYMGINIGAFLAPLVCSYLGERINWHYGFLAAGIGMVLGLVQYVYGLKYFGEAGHLSADSNTPERIRAAWKSLAVGIGLVVAIAAGLLFLRSTGTLNITLVTFAQSTGVILVVIAVLYFASVIIFGCQNADERKRVGVIACLFLGAAMFWSGFEQAGSSMSLFAENLTNRVIFGWEVPTGWFQSINALFIILLAPVVGMIWVKLGSRNPSIPVKFGMGLIMLGIGFLVLAWGSPAPGVSVKVSPNWLVATYFLHTIAELCLSPVGLSSITKLAPERLVSQMMGTWFLGAALGNLIAGLVAGFIESLPVAQIFNTVAMIVGATGFLFLLCSPLIKKLTHGIE
ncbi:MAG: peptide MFS transporter [Thermoanaerobaculia bacterium]|jgi:POT family proton-dependent oligopeptide transporter